MTLPAVWLPEAETDVREAVAWYRNVRAELSDRFVLAIETTMDAIRKNPLRFPIIYRNRRRAGVHRFPYGIFFEVQADRIVIAACFHGRRDPRRWQSR